MAARQQVTFVISARDKTRAAFRAIGRSIRRMRLGLASIVSGAAFGALTKATLEWGAALDASSKRLNVPVETLDALTQAANEFGVQGTDMVSILQRIGTRSGQALKDTDMLRAFQQLGVTWDDLKSNDPVRVMLKLADGMKKAADAGDLFASQEALIKIGDIEIGKQLGFLRQGSQPILDKMAALVAKGSVRDEAQAAELARQAQELFEVNKQLSKVSAEITIAFAPAAIFLGEALNSFVQAVSSGAVKDELTKTYDDAKKNASLIPEFLTAAFDRFTNRDAYNGGSVPGGLDTVGRFEAALLEETRKTNQILETQKQGARLR